MLEKSDADGKYYCRSVVGDNYKCQWGECSNPRYSLRCFNCKFALVKGFYGVGVLFCGHPVGNLSYVCPKWQLNDGTKERGNDDRA